MKPKRMRRKWLKKRHLKNGMVISLSSDNKKGKGFRHRRYAVLWLNENDVVDCLQAEKPGLYLFRGYMYSERDFMKPKSYGKMYDIPAKGGIQLVGTLSNTNADFDLIS